MLNKPLLARQLPPDPTVFRMQLVLPESALTFVLPLRDSAEDAYDFQLDWGDGNVNDIHAAGDAGCTHTYAAAGSYQLSIKGTCTGIAFFGNPIYARRVSAILAWGSIGAKTYNFGQCVSLVQPLPPVLVDSFSSVTSMESALRMTTQLSGGLPEGFLRGATQLTTMQSFAYNSNFSDPLPADFLADSPGIVNMSSCFYGCKKLGGTAVPFWDWMDLASAAFRPGWGENLSDHSQVYYNCSRLSDYADIPAGWK